MYYNDLCQRTGALVFMMSYVGVNAPKAVLQGVEYILEQLLLVQFWHIAYPRSRTPCYQMQS